jgi:hypothetical protein
MLISPVDLIVPLYNATGEQEFLEFFVKGTDQDLVPREKPFDIGSQVGLDVVLLEIGREMGQLAGHVVDNADSSEIDATISRMHNGQRRFGSRCVRSPATLHRNPIKQPNI